MSEVEGHVKLDDLTHGVGLEYHLGIAWLIARSRVTMDDWHWLSWEEA